VGFPLCSLWLNEVYDSRSILTTRNTKEIPQGAQGIPATYEIIEVNDIEWTIKEIFQHLVDVERILCYRALLIARNDPSATPDFDEKFISGNSKANDRNLCEIIEELIIERQSTIALFNSFDEEILLRKGRNWKYVMNVLGFGFCLVGHQIWHFTAIQEKYLDQVN